MSPEQALTIGQFLFPTAAQESATTRKVLAAVPDEGSDYRPGEKSMSAAELAVHIAISEAWFLNSILSGSFEGGEQPPALTKPSEALAFYDAHIPGLLAKVKEMTGEQLAKDTSFFVFTNPMVQYVLFYINHSVHHRGQLSAYLRPLGAKVPGIYGGSADEPMKASA